MTRDYERKIKLQYIPLNINRLLKIQHQPRKLKQFFDFPWVFELVWSLIINFHPDRSYKLIWIQITHDWQFVKLHDCFQTKIQNTDRKESHAKFLRPECFVNILFSVLYFSFSSAKPAEVQTFSFASCKKAKHIIYFWKHWAKARASCYF